MRAVSLRRLAPPGAIVEGPRLCSDRVSLQALLLVSPVSISSTGATEEPGGFQLPLLCGVSILAQDYCSIWPNQKSR